MLQILKLICNSSCSFIYLFNVFCCRYAAVYLCAGLENLIEESLLLCLPPQGAPPLTPVGLEQAVASRSELWGLLQPYAHLNAGRIANGQYY